ncbi:hypothetical protein D3C76_1382850 [compost metagenome]
MSCARRTLVRCGITRRIVRPGTPLAFFTPAKLSSTSTGAYRSLRTYTLSTPFFFMMIRRTWRSRCSTMPSLKINGLEFLLVGKSL